MGRVIGSLGRFDVCRSFAKKPMKYFMKPNSSRTDSKQHRSISFVCLVIFLALDILVVYYFRSYVLHVRAILQPTLATFENSVNISGVAGGNVNKKGGVIPVVDGYEIACGASFVGDTKECSKLSRSIVYGAKIDAKAVLIETMGGWKWLVLSIRTPSGQVYSTTPQSALDGWNEESDSFIKWAPFFLFFVLLVPVIGPLILIRLAKNGIPSSSSSK